MSKIQYVTLIIQLLAFLLSLMFYCKGKNKFILLVCLFLGLSVVTEFIGAYYLLKKKTGAEIIFYGYTFFEFNLVAIIYYYLLNREKKWSVLIFVLALVFNLMWFVTVFFKTTLFSYLIIIGSISNGIYIVLYLRKILLSNEVLIYKKSLAFWVSVGFLVFYLPSIPFFTLFKYMQDRGLFFILNILIILMNLFIIYGLLCSKKEKY